MRFNLSWYDSAAITAAEHESDFKLTMDIPYLTLTGKLWGVYWEDIGEHWPRYNSIALYIDGLVQERCNSIAKALELHLSCTNPSIYGGSHIGPMDVSS